jgi:hypothetical protein
MKYQGNRISPGSGNGYIKNNIVPVNWEILRKNPIETIPGQAKGCTAETSSQFFLKRCLKR